jgi:hypothetical protein
VVRYIGADAALASAVQQELNELQRERQEQLKLARLATATRRMLRESKQSLALLLDENGYAFHGYEIRRLNRRIKSEQSASGGVGTIANQSSEKREGKDDGNGNEPSGTTDTDRQGSR